MIPLRTPLAFGLAMSALMTLSCGVIYALRPVPIVGIVLLVFGGLTVFGYYRFRTVSDAKLIDDEIRSVAWTERHPVLFLLANLLVVGTSVHSLLKLVLKHVR